jgi:hypothetical protein
MRPVFVTLATSSPASVPGPSLLFATRSQEDCLFPIRIEVLSALWDKLASVFQSDSVVIW